MSDAKSEYIDLRKICTDRPFILGFSTLIIFFFHLPALTPQSYSLAVFLLQSPRWLLSFGVDVFLFLSGLGLYRSMLRDPDLKRFYARRAERVLPLLLLTGTVFAIIWRMEPLAAFDFITTLSFWKYGDLSRWYFALLIPLYILFPLLFGPVREGKLGFAAALAAVLGFNALLHIFAPGFYSRSIIALSRLPIFICGVFFARRCFSTDKSVLLPKAALIPCWLYILFSVFFLCVFNLPDKTCRLYCFCYYVLNRGSVCLNYIRSPLALCAMVIISSMELRESHIKTALIKLSAYSVSVYILQEKIQELAQPYFADTGFCMHTIGFDLVIVLLTAIASVITNAACDGIVKGIHLLRDKNRRKIPEKN